MNKNLMNLTWVVVNHPQTGFVANATFYNKAVFTKMWAYLAFKAPSYDSDKEYKMEWMRTVIDLEKAFKKRQKNFLTAVLMNAFVDSLDGGMSFPTRKVSRQT
jgi:hypothetical protein